jgi:hypothetical protein
MFHLFRTEIFLNGRGMIFLLSGAQPAPCPMGTWGSFPPGGGGWNWPLIPTSAEVKIKWIPTRLHGLMLGQLPEYHGTTSNLLSTSRSIDTNMAYFICTEKIKGNHPVVSNETVRSGPEVCGTWTGEWQRIVGVNYRPVLSSGRVLHNLEDRKCLTVIKTWSWAPDGGPTPRKTGRR